MVFGHLLGHCVGMAISDAARQSREQRQQQPHIIIQQTTNQPYPPPPGTGYLPGYQPFTNQPTTVVYNPQPAVVHDNVRPKNYMVLAILATVFCFFPFGIPAIIYASRVDAACDSGDYFLAYSSSSSARGWTIASCITGGIGYGVIAFTIIFAVVYNPYYYD